MPFHRIAANLSMSLNSVRKIWIDFDKANFLEKQRKNNHQRATSSDMDEAIVDTFLKNPFINCSEIKNKLNITASTKTIRSRIRESGLYSYSSEYQEVLRNNEEYRLEFAKIFSNPTLFPEDYWMGVVFTDEKSFYVTKHTHRRFHGPHYTR